MKKKVLAAVIAAMCCTGTLSVPGIALAGMAEQATEAMETSEAANKITMDDIIALSVKSDTVALKWSDFAAYKYEDTSSEASLWETEWTFGIDDEYTLKVCGKTDRAPDHIYLSDNSKRRIDIRTDDVKSFLNKGVGEDSISISEDIKEHFRVYETYSDENTKPERRLVQDFRSVMRFYNVPIRFVFTEYDNIDDILASAYATKKYFVVEQQDGSFKYYDEHLSEIRSSSSYLDIPEKAFAAFWDKEFVKKYISFDAELENIYYLSGETSHMGTAIYYKTSVGDYVYYNHYSLGEKLFPIGNFCKYQKAISDELANNPDENGSGDIDISDLMDLSKYELKNAAASSENIKGDANCDGKLDLADAILIMQVLANPNKYQLSEQGRANADMDGDGLTVDDALAIQMKLLGLDRIDVQSIDSSLIANKVFRYEKGSDLGIYDISFSENGSYYCIEGDFNAPRDTGTWNISGDTAVLTGQFGTNIFRYEDNALIYIAEGSYGFDNVKPKGGDKFCLVGENDINSGTNNSEGQDVSLGYSDPQGKENPRSSIRVALKCRTFIPSAETLTVDAAMMGIYSPEGYEDNSFVYDYMIAPYEDRNKTEDERLIVNGVNGSYEKEYTGEEREIFNVGREYDDYSTYHHETASLDFSNYQAGSSGSIMFMLRAVSLNEDGTMPEHPSTLGDGQLLYFYVGAEGVGISNVSIEAAEEAYMAKESGDVTPPEEYTGRWHGKNISSNLYEALTDPDSGTIPVMITLNDTGAGEFVYKGRKLKEYSYDLFGEDVSKLQQLLEQGDIIKYGEAVYTTGTPDEIKWTKAMYDYRIEFFGDELLSKYIINGEFLKEQLQRDLKELKAYYQAALDEGADAFYQAKIEETIKVLKEKGIRSERIGDTRNIVMYVTAAEFDSLDIETASYYGIVLVRSPFLCPS